MGDVSVVRVTGNYLPCKSCAMPLIITNGDFERGPVTVRNDEHGQTWLTPHATDCTRTEATR